MGSIGRDSASYEVRELERRFNELDAPRHRVKLVQDISNRLAMTEEPGYDEEKKEVDRTILKNLLKRIKNRDYGEDNF